MTTKNKDVLSAMFGVSKEKMSLVSYVPNKKKVVLVLSSMHSGSSINESTGDRKKYVTVTC